MTQSPTNFYVRGIFADEDIYTSIPPKYDEIAQNPSVEHNPLLTMPALI